MSVKVKGLDELNRAMAKFNRDEKAAVYKGLTKATLYIKGVAVNLAPVEFGALRGSAFTRVKKGRVISAIVGFTAKYAPFVHEAPMKLRGQPRAGRKGYYWQGGENKFLEKAIKRNVNKFIKIIADTVKRNHA